VELSTESSKASGTKVEGTKEVEVARRNAVTAKDFEEPLVGDRWECCSNVKCIKTRHGEVTTWSNAKSKS